MLLSSISSLQSNRTEPNNNVKTQQQQHYHVRRTTRGQTDGRTDGVAICISRVAFMDE